MRNPMLAAAVLALLPTAASAVIVSETNSTIAVVDGSSTTRDVTFAQSGTINDLNITIDFNKCDGEAYNAPGPCVAGGFSFNSEISFILVAPTLQQVTLVSAGLFGGNTPGQRSTITFDDAGAAIVSGSVPTTGIFAPVGSLSTFDGLNINGTWTLFIQDNVGLDALSFHSFTINADISDVVVPAPAAIALFGLGFAALGLRRRS